MPFVTTSSGLIVSEEFASQDGDTSEGKLPGFVVAHEDSGTITYCDVDGRLAALAALLTTIDADTGAAVVDLAAIETLLTTLANAVSSGVVQTDVLTRPAHSPLTDGQAMAPLADTVRGVGVSITDTSTDTLIAAQGAGIVINVTSVSMSNSDAADGTWVELLSASTVIWEGYLVAAGGSREVTFPQPLRCAANEALGVRCESAAEVRVTAVGFTTDEN